MVVPLDGIRAFHNAFRKDIKALDAAAYAAARQQAGLEPLLKHYVFFNEALDWHAQGEEAFVFPAVETVAPLVAEAYARDHRGLDTLSESLDKAAKSSDVLDIVRATGAFDFFLTFHLNKEEAHLYKLFEERLPVPDQWAVIGKLAQKIPQPRFPEVIAWLYSNIGPQDQENMTRILQRNLPPPAFAGVSQLIKTAVGDGWSELTSRIPELK